MWEKEIEKDIVITGEQLNLWFTYAIEKYKNTKMEEHLLSTYDLMKDNFFNSDLKSFLNRLTN